MSTFNTGAYPPGCTQRDVDEAQPGYWDEPPQEIVTCEACDGSGIKVIGTWVYEHGCGFGHASTDEIPCEHCLGLGEFVQDAKPAIEPCPYRMFTDEESAEWERTLSP